VNQFFQIMGKNGGARPGAGRKPGTRIITCVSAADILTQIDEAAYWKRYLDSPNDKVSQTALIYLTNRRDGLPHQSVSLDDKRSTKVLLHSPAQDITVDSDTIQ
jgi:hypothetical protein